MADTKISALPAASTPLTGSEVVPLNQSGVTSNVTVANLTAGRNITFNNTLPGYTTTATAAGTTTLTSSSTYHQRFTGSSAQTIVLPAATTMAQGQGFIIDNDSSGTLTLQDGSTASLGSVTPGMAVYVFCENNSTTAGSWSGYMFVPGGGPGGQVTWGTAGLAMGGQALSGVNTINMTGANLSGLTASSAVATDASKNLVSVTNTGTGNNVLATSPTLVTPALGTPSSVNLSNATSLAVAALPTGSVIQVVQATLTSSFSTTAASFTSTGLTASITPQFTTSKILVLISTYGLALIANGQASYTIYRSSTNLASGSGLNQSFSELNGNLSPSQAPLAISYLDSPSTTSSTSYTLYAASITAGDAIYINNASGTAAIILMEIR